MGVTTFDQLSAVVGRFKTVTQLPQLFTDYYGAVIELTGWQGGEIVYHTGDDKLYVQTATSGTTPTWKVVVTPFTTF